MSSLSFFLAWLISPLGHRLDYILDQTILSIGIIKENLTIYIF